MAKEKREYTFAQTFPTGTHAMWLYYWLAAHGINPLKDAKVITVPPPQMVANMRVGNMDGFCVGEPWGHRAIMDGIGFTAVTTQDIWKDHPEKVLGTTAEFVKKNPNTARAVTAADARSRQVDRRRPAEQARRWPRPSPTRATSTPASTRSTSASWAATTNGMGKTWDDPNHMKFYNDGAVNFPYLSDGMWFLTQHKRWGLLKEHPDYLAVAKQINQIDIYKQAAARDEDAACRRTPMRTQQADRRRGLGRQGPEEVRRVVQGQCLRSPTMVSAVFHSPLEAAAGAPRRTAPRPRRPRRAPVPPAEPAARGRAAPARAARLAAALWLRGAAADPGLRACWSLIWELVALRSTTGFPSPLATWQAGARGVQRPVLQQGPERPGHRLERAARRCSAWRIGFGLAAAVGIPLGFVIGRFAFLARMFNPLISLLRPVSPLAWLPIGLLVFKGANPAAIWTIFICSIWPMIINTAVGVQRVPQRLPERRARAEPVASGRSSPRSCSPPCCPTC